MLIRTIIFTIVFSILSACTLPGTQSENTTEEGIIQYSGSGWSMNIPSTWNTQPDKSIPSPKNGITSLTAVSPEVRYGFSNNIIILEDTLDTPMTSKRYSELNQIQTTRNYLEYTKISDDAILFVGDDESRVTVFEARYNTTTARMKFIQTAKVCGTKVYLIHAAIALDKNPDNYISLFKTFTCN